MKTSTDNDVSCDDVIIECLNFAIKFCEKFVGVIIFSSKVLKEVCQWPVQPASPSRHANG